MNLTFLRCRSSSKQTTVNVLFGTVFILFAIQPKFTLCHWLQENQHHGSNRKGLCFKFHFVSLRLLHEMPGSQKVMSWATVFIKASKLLWLTDAIGFVALYELCQLKVSCNDGHLQKSKEGKRSVYHASSSFTIVLIHWLSIRSRDTSIFCLLYFFPDYIFSPVVAQWLNFSLPWKLHCPFVVIPSALWSFAMIFAKYRPYSTYTSIYLHNVL